VEQSWVGKKIMVTGASGFFGSALRRRLVKEGAEVHGISRTHRSSKKGNLHWWHGDIADIGTARHLVRAIKPDVIFHLSGFASATPDINAVLPTFHSLVTSTVNMLLAASEVGCTRFVSAGSSLEPLPESLTPSSPYAAAKGASSAYGRMFHKLYGLPIVTLRIFMTYGAGQSHNKLIPYVVRSLLQDEAPKLASGKQQIDWVYIDDVVNGLVAAALTPGVEGTTIDLGSGKVVAIKSLVEQVAEIIGSKAKPLFGVLPDRPLESVRKANVERSNALLGWQPTVSLDEGLRRTVHWHRDQLKAMLAASFVMASLVESA
jgi:UDP-glucose 4-epimerase